MEMAKGMAIIEKTDTETKGFFIDQEAIEFARLNAYTKKRIAQAEAAKHKAYLAHRKAEKVAARRKAYNLRTAKAILIHGGICVAATWFGMAGMVHPGIWIPTAIFSLCQICLRFGAWLGRKGKVK